MRPSLPASLWLILLFLAHSLPAQVNLHNFEGMDAATETGAQLDVDPNGAVGTKQYLEWVNSSYQAYDKITFAPVFAKPVLGDAPWRAARMSSCYGTNGAGVVLFDHLASRWVLGRRQGTSSYYYCMAVSNTDDLTSSTLKWNVYQLSLNSLLGHNSNLHTYFPDYPRIGTWSDGYYVSMDLQDPDLHYKPVGVLVCAFDRTNMLLGTKAKSPQCFRTPNPPTTGLFRSHSLLPADIEGRNAPPAGAAENFIGIVNPSGKLTTSTALNLWKFHVDWTTPANSSFVGPTAITVTSYTPGCYTVAQPLKTTCVPEPSSASTLIAIDSVGDRLMHRFAYRRFLGTSARESYIVTHTVLAGSNQRTGIRWYEMRPTGQIVNSGTISPSDTTFRFMPSAAQDKVGNLAVGYSASGTVLHPAIRASYLNLPSHSAPTEFNLMTGTADEENSFHWGDYTSMTVDPVDDCTFWYVNEYYTQNQTGTGINWQTNLSNFKIVNCQ